MQHLKVSGAVRPLKWSLGVKWLITTAQTTHVWKLGKQSQNSDGLFFSKTCFLTFPPLWSRQRCHGSVMTWLLKKWISGREYKVKTGERRGEIPVLLVGASLLKFMEIVWTNRVCDTSLNCHTRTVFTESYNKLLTLKYYVAILLGQTFVLYLLRLVLILLQLQSLNHVFLLSNGPRIHASQWNDTENPKTAEDSAVAATQYMVQGTSKKYMNRSYITYLVMFFTLRQWQQI